MNSLNASGIRKFFFPYDYVETSYKSIEDIPVLNLNKQIIYLKQINNKQIIIVHLKKIQESLQRLQKLEQIPNSQLYVIPQQNSLLNFAQIKAIYPKALGKMEINGKFMHPLMKFIKKNCTDIYNFKMLGAPPLTQSFGVFVRKSNDHNFKYYKNANVEEFLHRQTDKNTDC